jgi:tetratricopeptide (TPR) repeat protein
MKPSRLPRDEPDRALHGVAVYNPDLLSRDELKRYFVGRLPLLERMLADLRRERPGAIPQHRLILGQRGMGKTSLLRRLAIAIEEDPELSATWLPLTFPEEQYNIAGLTDLWLNCLDALGDALERAGRLEQADELDAQIESLSHTGADTAALLQALLERARRLDRRLLLLLDNADLILGRLRDEDWALREALQSHPELLVFAASAGAIEASYRYDAAFYDFFRIDELKGFTEEELRVTLIRLSELGNTPAVAELVERDPARIRTLHTLTGGNPRTAVLLYGVLAQGPSGDVRTDLEGLLDRVTPLYKARFEELSELGQRLVDALALHWDPASARMLADRLGWEVNLISAQLKRLQDQGVVEKTAPFRGKRTLFQLAERFFNIWYLMRASRRVRRRLTWLVRFLRIFYTSDELRSRARHQLGLAGHSGRGGQRQAEYSLALAQCIDETPLRSALETHGLRGLVDDGETSRRLSELLDLGGEDAGLANRAERLQILAEARERISAALNEAKLDLDREGILLRVLGSPFLSLARKRAIGNHAATLPTQRWLEAERVLAHDYAGLEKRLGIDPFGLYRAIAEGDMEDSKDTEGAAAAVERLDNPDILAMAWLSRGKTGPKQAEHALQALTASRIDTAEAWHFRGYQLHEYLARYEEAVLAYQRAIEIDPNFASPWNDLGNLFQRHLARYKDAEQAYRNAIGIDPNFAWPWNGLGNLLKNHLARYDEAERAYRRAIDIDPAYAGPWNGLGNLLQENLARYGEAEQAYRRAIDIDSDSAMPWNNLGILLKEHLARYKEAEQAYRRAIDIDPNYATPWSNLGILLQDVLRLYIEAEQAYRHAIEIDSGDAHPWNNLGILLSEHLGRYKEAEQAFHRAIDLDPDYVDPWNNLGKLLTQYLARYEDAELAYRRAIEIAPSDAHLWFALGYLLHQHLDRYDEAEQAFRRAVEIDPDADAGYNGLAWLLYQQGHDENEAQALAERALALAPERLDYVHTLACILVRLGDWLAAATLIRRLINEGGESYLEAIWDDMLVLFQETVQEGKAAETRDLLDAGEAGERWRPLREALAAAAAGSADYLRQVAPEVAGPAREIYRRLVAEPAGSASSKDS